MAEPPHFLIEAPSLGMAMDVLGHVLSGMKLSGGVFLEAQFTAPWCVISEVRPADLAAWFPDTAHVISYHYVIDGCLYCCVDNGDEVEVHAGQILLLPRNEKHRLGSCVMGNAIDAHALLQPPHADGLTHIRYGGGGETAQIYCGFLGTVAPINAFLMSLPSILVVDVSEGPSGEWLASSMRFAGASGGNAELLGPLAELLFGQAVRRYVEAMPEDRRGWIAGLRDPFVAKALTLLHAHYAEAWTTSSLAREVGLSRSALAERFSALLGEPPMRYCARLRMNIAANLLRQEQQNASNVAYSVGFNSEAAFNRAFKKEFGVPPGSWRKTVAVRAPQPALPRL